MKVKLKVDKKRASKIPKEFALEKYDKCKKWGLEEWYRAISYRSSIRDDWNKSVRKKFDEEDILEIYSYYKQQVFELIDNPLEIGDGYEYSGNQILISDQSVVDLFEEAEDERLINSLWWTKYSEWRQMDFYSRYFLGPENAAIENVPSWIMKKDQWGLIKYATIHVDMDGEDSEIVDKFKDWLRATRSKMKLPKIPEVFTSDNFSDWCLDRVLPCFDLKFYEVVNNVKFKSSDITKTLFPHGKKLHGNELYDDDKIRKTVVPNALRIVSSKMAKALAREFKNKI